MMRNNLQPLNPAKTVYSVALLAVFFLVALASAHAGQVTLGWNANTEPPALIGYKVYYRTASTTYATQPGNPVAVVPKSTNPQTTITLPDGSYYFAVTAYNSTGQSGFSKEVSTTLGTSLVANFSASPNPISGLAPLRVTFTDQSSGSVSKWTWNFGDGSASSNAINPTHDYTTAGNYTVSLTVTDSLGNQSSPKTMPVQVTFSSSGPGPLPSPWKSTDIGSVGLAGSARYESNGTYTLQGSGAYIYSSADSFHFAYQPLTGNGTIVARVTSMDTSTWACAGVMIRENLSANARNAFVFVTKDNRVYFQWRLQNRGSTSASPLIIGKAPEYLKLKRSGSTFTAYLSGNGSTWTQIGSPITINMASSVYVGLALSSRNNSALTTAKLDQVNLSNP